ncbi:MAG TPA: STAS/SEC14 domain-containing protein [Chloroflexia bacterium]|nr:STAS/SEC14 domain-containing protein [Chloroflexia bacterium]
METYYQTPFVDISWEADPGCVYTAWHGYHTDEQGRHALEKGLELLVQKGAHCWLGDQRHRAVFSLSFQQWSDEQWFPRAIASGLRRLAIVNSDSALTRMAANRLAGDLAARGLAVAFFNDPDAARSWLRDSATNGLGPRPSGQ